MTCIDTNDVLTPVRQSRNETGLVLRTGVGAGEVRCNSRHVVSLNPRQCQQDDVPTRQMDQQTTNELLVTMTLHACWCYFALFFIISMLFCSAFVWCALYSFPVTISSYDECSASSNVEYNPHTRAESQWWHCWVNKTLDKSGRIFVQRQWCISELMNFRPTSIRGKDAHLSFGITKYGISQTKLVILWAESMMTDRQTDGQFVGIQIYNLPLQRGLTTGAVVSQPGWWAGAEPGAIYLTWWLITLDSSND